MIDVTLTFVPGRKNEYTLEDGATVGDLLSVAEVSAEGYLLQVNAADADSSTVLYDGDRVTLAKGAKGNQ